MAYDGDITMGESSLQPEAPQAPTHHTSGADYVLTFGRHKGQKLSQVPTSYLRWLSENVTYPAPVLTAALFDLGFTKDVTTFMEVDWIPTPLPDVPEGFHEWRKLQGGLKSEDTVMWITRSDTERYFNLSDEILQIQQVPKLPSSKIYVASGSRYALHHVWDLARVYFRREAADEFLTEFWNDKRGISKGKFA
jgi:uncharacterized protein (DUF3820 family)